MSAKRGRVEAEVYEQTTRRGEGTGIWRYRITASNGQVTGGPQEGYSTKSNARRALRAFMSSVFRTVMDELIENPPVLPSPPTTFTEPAAKPARARRRGA